MSHVVTIQTEVRDAQAVRLACTRLQLPQPTQGQFRLFGSDVAGLGFLLPEWKFPVVCQLETGQVLFDNFGGRWGEQAHLDRFLQAYAVEKARLEARRQGHMVTEQALVDGSVKLTIQVGGAA